MSILLASLLVHWAAAVPGPPLEPLGTLDRQRIPEASGIVKSRRYPEIFWVHNDSGNPPLLFAIRRDGKIVREFRLEVPNIDWEDIAIDDQGHLYLGDIGNNGGVLPLRGIYRIDEPDPAEALDRPLRASSSAFYAFPSKERFDAEGLIYDGGTAILVAKYLDSRPAELFTISLEKPAPLFLPSHPESGGQLPGFTEPATGASLNEKRDLLAVCSSDVTRVYERDERARCACFPRCGINLSQLRALLGMAVTSFWWPKAEGSIACPRRPGAVTGETLERDRPRRLRQNRRGLRPVDRGTRTDGTVK